MDHKVPINIQMNEYYIYLKEIYKKNKYKKAKQLSKEGLQIAEQRREAKGKGEKERYTHLNAEFQSIAMRDKKALLSEQRKEVEGKKKQKGKMVVLGNLTNSSEKKRNERQRRQGYTHLNAENSQER